MCRIIPLHHPMWWQSVEPLSTVIRTATSSTSSTQNNMNTGGGGGTISPYEARPSYQNVISNLVGNFRGYPDVASDYCCAAIYLQGAWVETGGTSWATRPSSELSVLPVTSEEPPVRPLRLPITNTPLA